MNPNDTIQQGVAEHAGATPQQNAQPSTAAPAAPVQSAAPAPGPDPVPATPAAQAPAPAPAPQQSHAEKMTLLQGLRASALDKHKIHTRNADLSTQLTTAQAQLTALTAERDQLRAENTELTEGLNSLTANFNTQLAEQSTVVAAEQLATVGQPMTELPAAASLNATPEQLTADELWSKAGEETDPGKKAQLMAQARKAERAEA